ncbi:hypothetical protein AO729_08945 [Pseudomonas sp. TTU2014-066ASC]|uniref:hypothetical protein n=1 Tax=Stutzerimonas nitrititolerans TaxID=2482751 RepID=UPI0007183623|nr:hypothetical protein [Stutzerimonas nitrititolerans]KRW63370.1 hypothetical protein AO729_08945 [Pseudomonas sp. TTU2014-066ASC]
MSIRTIAATALATSIITASVTAWIVGRPADTPEPVIPPLLFSEVQGELVIWGAWKTTEGYDDPSIAATEIRCSKERMTCTEGVGHLLIHDAGQDLEAEAYSYEIANWSDTSISAVATRLMAECLERRVFVNLSQNSAELRWAPTSECKGGDTGKAVLVGDESEVM